MSSLKPPDGTFETVGLEAFDDRLDDLETIEVVAAAPTGIAVTDKAAIEAAISLAGWPLQNTRVKLRPGSYRIDSTITLDGLGAFSTAPLTFVGEGTQFITTAAVSPMFHITNSIVSATFVTFIGCQFYTNASAALAIKLTNAQACEFRSCLFTASGSIGIEVAGQSTSNRIVNCLFYNQRRGILASGNADHLVVSGCQFMEGLLGSPLNWIEVSGQSNGIQVVGNHFWGQGATLPVVRFTLARASIVANNTFFRCFEPAVEIGGLGSADACTVQGNSFQHSSNHDIVLRNSNRCSVTGNTFFGVSTDETPAPNTFANIRIIDQFGINRGSNNSIIGNQSLATAAEITNVVEADSGCLNNIVIGNSGLAGISVPDTTNVVQFNTPGNAKTVASAGTITIPGDADFVTISGTTNITSVTASYIGREVTLLFSGILTFTDGSNLKLAGNFVTTADDTITLKCDGTNWWEMSRAVI